MRSQFAALGWCLPLVHTVLVSTVDDLGMQVANVGDSRAIEHACVSLCTPDALAAFDEYGAPAASPSNISSVDGKNRTEFSSFEDFSLSFLQVSGRQLPFSKLEPCLPTCHSHMVLCLHRDNPTAKTHNASVYASCLAQASTEKQVADNNQDQLNALRQKEQSQVATLLCSDLCHDAKVKDLCHKQCSNDMVQCLDRLTNEQCEQMLGPDFKDYGDTLAVQKIQPKALRAHRHTTANTTESKHKLRQLARP